MKADHRCKHSGFTFLEMLLATLLLAVFCGGLMAAWEQLAANRQERMIQMEALMLAQNRMEGMRADFCRPSSEQVVGKHGTYLLRQQATDVEPGLIWCQIEVEWREGTGGALSAVQLGKLFQKGVVPEGGSGNGAAGLQEGVYPG
ncbi:MAG: hypothetical protein BAA01_12455 [Bacillus thermozeamaize]|uniref:Prepilin-type N-terminal cleavage/methylation domain-containing protein n=1 Tax=Bacillus thermozeamaize TaxID=230954 RepID=A0A1Y3PJA5_9BACI|nr:MAG: hypothetical protein BAA01_12455 [Bacillus thermozeamaize]